MKPPCILLLTGTILATTVHYTRRFSRRRQPSPQRPSSTRPLPTLNASVILQPQYFQGPNFTVRNPVPTYSGSNNYTINSTPVSGYSVIVTGVVSPMTAQALAADGVNVTNKSAPGPLQ
jgi:hypothetical protein